MADRRVIAAEAEAEVAQIQAEADREVLQIQADAAEYAGKKDAAVNEAVASSLTEILLQYYTIKQWNGELPIYFAGAEDADLLSLIFAIGGGETPAQTPVEAPADTPAASDETPESTPAQSGS